MKSARVLLWSAPNATTAAAASKLTVPACANVHKSSFSTTTPAGANKSFKLVVIGGGAGGCSTAAKFASKLGKGNVAVIEPRDTHFYQPYWTMVGGNIKNFEDSGKPMGSVLPKKAEWIKQKVVGFDPANNKLTTSEGDEISYEFLVVAMGLQLNYQEIKGLPEALDTPGVCSNYHPSYVKKTYPSIVNFKSGNAIFTLPNTPIKCAGAPQKAMYITEHHLRKMGKRANAKVLYHTSLPVIFGVKKYADALWEEVKKKDIDVTLRSNLIEVNADKREAVFQNLDKPDQLTVLPYELLHVVPPMSAPNALKDCKELVDACGYLNVDKETLQHVKYKNIFGIGDCANVPTSKTAAAVAGEVGILRQNLNAAIKGQPLPAKYNGYTSCPLVVDHGKVILAEFDFSAPPKPMETFPFDQSKARWTMYFMKANLMPTVYWNMLRGYWEGPYYVRMLMHLGMAR